MTTYTPSLLLAKCQLVVGEAARRSVSGSLGPGNFTMVRWLWLSAHAQRSSAHWTVYGVVRAGWLRGAHSCTLLPCNNRKWAAAAKNNLNVWHSEWDTTTTVGLTTASRSYNLQHSHWYNVIQWKYIIEIELQSVKTAIQWNIFYISYNLIFPNVRQVNFLKIVN